MEKMGKVGKRKIGAVKILDILDIINRRQR
jgi:hypothetical protein